MWCVFLLDLIMYPFLAKMKQVYLFLAFASLFILAAATQAQILPFRWPSPSIVFLPLKSLLIDFFVPWKVPWKDLSYALSNVLVSQPAISDPDELGSSLATQCFSQAQLSIDAKLGIDGEFSAGHL